MSTLSRDTVSGEALFILKNLRENARQGRSNKLSEVKSALEPAVTLEFDSYFFFLRKFHYIALDREAQLKLTEEGDRLVDGHSIDRLADEVADFFAEQLMGSDDRTYAGALSDITFDDPPPPPVPTPNPPTIFPPPPVPPQAPVSTKGIDLDQRYVKYDQVGSGPLGTVYKGRQNSLGLEVCVKELKDIFGYFSFLQRGEVIKRLKKELCAQAQVRHPGIVAVLDQNTEVARPYFVMELMKGSLRESLEKAGGKPLPVKLAVRYFLQLAYALRAAHQAGLTHHNLKPENVLFDAWGNAKLADFGLARVIEVDSSKGMPQVIVGTGGMAYMAPELIARTRDVGPAADVYALGFMLYEMLTGQLPGRRSPMPSEVNPEVTEKLDPIFDKMTQDRRDARYPDFDAMLDEFYEAFVESEYLARGDLLMWSERVA